MQKNYHVCLHSHRHVWMYAGPLKQLARSASLNYNIYIATDPTPVVIDHAAHAVGPQCVDLLSES